MRNRLLPIRRLLTPIFLVLATTHISAQSTRADDNDKPSLDELLKQYRELGLPLPSKEAILIRYQSGRSHVDEKGRTVSYVLGFLLEPGDSETWPKVLTGIRELQPSYDIQPKALDPDSGAIQHDCEAESEEWLITAIQCHSRGWTKLAEQLLEKSLSNTKQPPAAALSQSAWAYWQPQLERTGSDWAKVAKHLKSLLETDVRLDTEKNRYLVKSLEFALGPSNAKPGSVEAVIDDLINYGCFLGIPGAFDLDGLYRRLVAENSLRGLAGDEMEPAVSGDRLIVPKKEPVANWQERVAKIGEETYLLANVFPYSGKEASAHKSVNDPIGYVISIKRSKSLAKLYLYALEGNSPSRSSAVVEAIAESNLPKEEKITLLVAGTGHRNVDHRFSAFREIRKLDEQRYLAILREGLDKLPDEVPGEYENSPYVNYANLARETDDDRVWESFKKAALRASPGWRMELLNHLDRSTQWRLSDALRKRQLGLLASFLDDRTIRDTKAAPERYRHFCAGFMYEPRLALRDFAAMKMAPFFDIKVEFNSKRTEPEWAKLRERVCEAWEHEKERDRKSESRKPGDK